ncbi:unnamed protein product [Cochlearia groenlandica]
MESNNGVPIEKVLASILIFNESDVVKTFLDNLEEKGIKGIALATLRKSDRLFTSHDEYKSLFEPLVYSNLIVAYRNRGEKRRSSSFVECIQEN